MSVSVAWLLAAAAFFALEAFGAPGVGFLFVGIAAIISALLIELSVIPADAYVWQFGAFFALSAAAAALLWKKLKRLHVSPSEAQSYSNIIGDEAIVVGALVKGQRGNVLWSGTRMQAELDAASSADSLSDGARVRITAAHGIVLTVTPI